MNTEYTIGNIRIPFASRARRRWFVGLIYAVLAVYAACAFLPLSKSSSRAWMVAGCLMLFVGLMIVFTWIAGDMRAHGDERETHRRDHAHYVAYRAFNYVVLIAFITGFSRGPNPLLTLIPAALRGNAAQWHQGLLVMVFLLYGTLPQAILMWTEPDMDAGVGGAR